jgi:hypothetical protein
MMFYCFYLLESRYRINITSDSLLFHSSYCSCMVFANRTYLDSLNRYIVLRYYKALLAYQKEAWFLLSLDDNKMLRCISQYEESYKSRLHLITSGHATSAIAEKLI